MKRIQRQRTKGWRMAEGAVYVGRPSRFGNPVRTGNAYLGGPPLDDADAVGIFRSYVDMRLSFDPDWLAPLHGHDLVCWCPLDQPCHADVLLELANA